MAKQDKVIAHPCRVGYLIVQNLLTIMNLVSIINRYMRGEK
jgi:hypothetical protein